jgi:hypothetical protein
LIARINLNGFEEKHKERNNIHNDVYATYCIFEIDNEKYFQIDTYGSPDREFVGKISQAIQFDRAFAEELVNILKNEFNI